MMTPHISNCAWGSGGVFSSNARESSAHEQGVGRHQLPMITMGILLAGHIRVRFEDNIYLRKGVLAKSNAQMLEMAVNLVEMLHEVATADDARRILAMSNGTSD